MATENEIRDLAHADAIRSLKKRGIRQGTVEWTVEYHKAIAAAMKEFGRALSDLNAAAKVVDIREHRSDGTFPGACSSVSMGSRGVQCMTCRGWSGSDPRYRRCACRGPEAA